MKKEKNMWPLIGNEHITEFLEKIIAKNKVSGSYIFNGPDNLGKTTIAKYFAKSLLCQERVGSSPCENCPACKQFNISQKNSEDAEIDEDGINTHGDFHIIRKEKDKKNISIEQIRGFIRTLSMSSFLNSYKIGIVKHAESLSQEAANALLKTLEEPRKDVIIILITHSIEALPKTIVSRSKILNFHPVKFDIIYENLIDEHGASRSTAKNLAYLSLGRPALATKFLEDKDFFDLYKERAESFARIFSLDINDRLEAVGKLFDKKVGSQEAVVLAKRIIEIWQGMSRDWLLLEYGHVDLVQHKILEEEIKAIKAKFTFKHLISFNQALREARENLFANVNPKLVLENIVLSI